jgi:hypothetical protein
VHGPNTRTQGAGLTDGPSPILIWKKILNTIWTDFLLSKDGLTELKKIQIKYGDEGFEIRNNFYYCNVSRFRIEFELKFRGLLWVKFN